MAMAYWFFKGKKYDPHPFSYFAKIRCRLFGCNLNKTDITTDAAGELCLSCRCGVTYCYKKKYR
jgi:hypothetical protein